MTPVLTDSRAKPDDRTTASPKLLEGQREERRSYVLVNSWEAEQFVALMKWEDDGGSIGRIEELAEEFIDTQCTHSVCCWSPGSPSFDVRRRR